MILDKSHIYLQKKYNFMRRTIFSLVFASMMLTSCATIVSGSRQTVKFASNPSNANILIDDVVIGKTPFETKLARNKNYKVSIQLDGYLPYETRLTKKFNAWYLGNIVFGGLVGLVVDPITGAIYQLTPKEVNAQLQKGTVFKNSKNEIFIAVSLEIDKNWEKVGQLEKM